MTSRNVEPQESSPTNDLPSNTLSIPKNVVVLPFEDPQLLAHFAETNRSVVYKYLLKRLKTAIHSNMDSITIFQFSSQKSAEIEKSKYDSQLNIMMKWFVETEDYESAGKCRDLLRHLAINIVVDQSM